MADVAVTSVTVVYAIGGKSFTVTFADLGQIGAIVFNKKDLNRLRKELFEEMNKKPKEIRLDPLTVIQPTVDGESTHASSAASGTNLAVAAANNGLWWHTNACTWFHPETQT